MSEETEETISLDEIAEDIITTETSHQRESDTEHVSCTSTTGLVNEGEESTECNLRMLLATGREKQLKRQNTQEPKEAECMTSDKCKLIINGITWDTKGDTGCQPLPSPETRIRVAKPCIWKITNEQKQIKGENIATGDHTYVHTDDDAIDYGNSVDASGAKQQFEEICSEQSSKLQAGVCGKDTGQNESNSLLKPLTEINEELTTIEHNTDENNLSKRKTLQSVESDGDGDGVYNIESHDLRELLNIKRNLTKEIELLDSNSRKGESFESSLESSDKRIIKSLETENTSDSTFKISGVKVPQDQQVISRRQSYITKSPSMQSVWRRSYLEETHEKTSEKRFYSRRYDVRTGGCRGQSTFSSDQGSIYSSATLVKTYNKNNNSCCKTSTPERLIGFAGYIDEYRCKSHEKNESHGRFRSHTEPNKRRERSRSPLTRAKIKTNEAPNDRDLSQDISRRINRERYRSPTVSKLQDKHTYQRHRSASEMSAKCGNSSKNRNDRSRSPRAHAGYKRECSSRNQNEMLTRSHQRRFSPSVNTARGDHSAVLERIEQHSTGCITRLVETEERSNSTNRRSTQQWKRKANEEDTARPSKYARIETHNASRHRSEYARTCKDDPVIFQNSSDQRPRYKQSAHNDRICETVKQRETSRTRAGYQESNNDEQIPTQSFSKTKQQYSNTQGRRHERAQRQRTGNDLNHFPGRSVQQNNNARGRRAQRMGIQERNRLFEEELNKLQTQTSNDIAVFFGSSNEDLENYLFMTKNKDISQYLPIFSLLTESTCRTNVRKALGVISGAKFFDRDDIKNKLGLMFCSPSLSDDDVEFVRQVLKLAKAVAKEVNDCEKDIRSILMHVTAILSKIESEDCKRELQDRLTFILNSFQTVRLPSGANEDNGQMADDEDVVIPTLEELRQNKVPKIDAHPLDKAFNSTFEYLNYLFRLFREDFIRPLRRGINNYIAHLNQSPKERFRDPDIAICEHCYLLESRCSKDDGVVWSLQLENTKFRHSMDLKWGSLIGLTNDGCNTLILGTVAGMDAARKLRGIIEIDLVGANPDANPELFQTEFVMVESRSFYTSYSHTLKVIKCLATSAQSGQLVMPFQDQIVRILPANRLPNYIVQNSQAAINFNCISSLYSNRHVHGDRDYFLEYKEDDSVSSMPLLEGNDSIDSQRAFFDFEDTSRWPSMKEIGLDDSQYKALKHALTSELAIIQGPPGTGKTLMGLKLIELLLNNTKLWQGSETAGQDRCPILVLSYTNHALDQILQSVAKMQIISGQADIVRVGSRCEVEELCQFNMAKHRRFAQQSSLAKCRSKLKTRELQHEARTRCIQSHFEGILHEHYLRQKSIVTDAQVRQLRQVRTFGNISSMSFWLEIFSESVSDEETDSSSDIQLLQEETWEDSKQDRFLDVSDSEESVEGCNGLNVPTSLNLPICQMSMTKEMLLAVQYCRQGEDGEEIGQKTVYRMNQKEREDLWKQVSRELEGQDTMSHDEANAVSSLWDLEITDRWRLYRYWRHRAVNRIRKDLLEVENSYRRSQKRYFEAKAVVDANIMKNAKVIAMTTTRAAMSIDALRMVGPRIIVVEEAAQVPDHHLIAALTTSCHHLILIGDHLQLRPAYNDHELSMTHHTNISIFERLARNGCPKVQLKYQHRMRPEISRFLTPHIYSVLHDHGSVLKYDNIRGVGTNVFFLNHKAFDEQSPYSSSYFNTFEANFVAKLYRYLRLQGYSYQDITVLSPYNSQVRLLREIIRQMEKEDNLLNQDDLSDSNKSQYDSVEEARKQIDTYKRGVRITAVDNFQGEENQIILLSLVRSNKDDNIGYLREQNRICVSLSRAKQGFYVIGNLDSLSAKSKTWRAILNQAKLDKVTGNAIQLRCENHPDTTTDIATETDFSLVFDGGCRRLCSKQKHCGHICERLCHFDDPKHQRPCKKICRKKICEEGHRCEKMCHENCERCQLLVEKVLPKCGHSQNVVCSDVVEDVVCNHQCEKTLICAHRCQRKCGEKCNTSEDCHELVKVSPACGHECQVACYTQYDPECTVACNATLACGHECKGKCGKCFQGRLHQPCQKRRENLLLCGHMQNGACGVPLSLCDGECTVTCSHRKENGCPRRCSAICIPCREPCDWKCLKECPNSFKCDNDCWELCERPRCNTPCNRKLKKCGHPCPGLLCEKCPNFCKFCNKLDIFLGHEEEDDAVFIQLEACCHVFEVRDLDYWMDSHQQSGDSKELSAMKRCPRCTVSIKSASRYCNSVKKINAEMDELKKTLLSHNSGRNVREQKEKMFQMIKNTRAELGDYKDAELTISKIRYNLDKANSYQKICTIENQILFLLRIIRIHHKVTKLDTENDRDTISSLNSILKRLRKRLETTNNYRFTDQELEEFPMELLRLDLLVDVTLLHKDVKKISSEDFVQTELTEIQELTEKLNGFNLKMDALTLMSEKLTKLREKHPMSGIGLSNFEVTSVVKAMEFRASGHWYKCKNGHIYAIGECGGAMEEAVCPYCNETIGGYGHYIRDGNTRAEEMEQFDSG